MTQGEFELGTDGPTAILVGVDDTVTSIRAASYAVGLARRQGARVIVVYVSPNAVMMTSAAGAAVLAAENEAHDALAEDLRARAETVGRELGIEVTFIAAHGDPYHEIVRVADQTHADAIVVGASTQAGHRLLGSLAVRLVKAGKWPVTVVP